MRQSSTSGVSTHGATYWRGDMGYDAARRDTCWNEFLPGRFPEVIVQAQSEDDVRAALSLARDRQFKVGIRSGGHSWSANHIRDGGMLLDLSRLNDIAIDKPAMRAAVGPGCKGDRLLAALSRQGLFFPVGHCTGVGIGGFLLQGGYGWHSRELGPACMSVEAIDVVTADGELLHANEQQNADLYWAARGSGPGFFGVVTKFYLRVYPKPKLVGASVQHYPISMLDDVFRWAHEAGPSVPQSVELMLVVSHEVPGVKGPGIVVVAPVIANSLGEVRNSTDFMRKSPLLKQSAFSLPFLPTGFRALLRAIKTHYPDGYNYSVDNMWTHAPIESLLPGLRAIAASLPAAPSHMLWMNWAPPEARTDMAYSVEDDIYIALYSAWKRNADEDAFRKWPLDHIKAMEHLSTGIQLADENLGRRPGRFMTDANMRRLDQIRTARDPAGRFHPWMGRL